MERSDVHLVAVQHISLISDGLRHVLDVAVLFMIGSIAAAVGLGSLKQLFRRLLLAYGPIPTRRKVQNECSIKIARSLTRARVEKPGRGRRTTPFQNSCPWSFLRHLSQAVRTVRGGLVRGWCGHSERKIFITLAHLAPSLKRPRYFSIGLLRQAFRNLAEEPHEPQLSQHA